MGTRLGLVAASTICCASLAASAELHLQTDFAPLFLTDAPEEGAHPIGGPIMRFVTVANGALAPFGRRLVYHVSGEVPASDDGRVRGPIADIERFGSIYAAVAAGSKGDGVDIGAGIANQSGLSFGSLFVAGLPFGLEPDEFASYLFDGGGLALQQRLYDAHFEGRLVVLPLAITPTQGGGWFPDALPDPDNQSDMTPVAAMQALCTKAWIVRWPEPGAGVWRHACETAGTPAAAIGDSTRCEKSDAACPAPDNPVAVEIDRLSFGGFVPGTPPHVSVKTGNVDGYELNLPSSEVHLIRIATGQGDIPSADADLSAVVGRAPFYYGQTWHQPLTYVELLINRPFWESLKPAERRAIRLAAESTTLRSWTAALSRQGQALALLQRNGAVIGRWPQGLLDLLREATDEYLNTRAAELTRAGDDDFSEVLVHMRKFQQAQQDYADFGDVNQGRAALPTTPVIPTLGAVP